MPVHRVVPVRLLLLLAALSLPLAPVALRAQTGTNPSADSARIAALELETEAAVARHDFAALDRIYAPDFLFTHSSGRVQTRAELLAPFPPGREPPPGAVYTRSLDSLQVEVHGDVALSTGRIHVVRGPAQASPPVADYTIRYARIWARRGGHWQLVTHHSTAYAEGAPPPLAGH